MDVASTRANTKNSLDRALARAQSLLGGIREVFGPDRYETLLQRSLPRWWVKDGNDVNEAHRIATDSIEEKRKEEESLSTPSSSLAGTVPSSTSSVPVVSESKPAKAGAVGKVDKKQREAEAEAERRRAEEQEKEEAEEQRLRQEQLRREEEESRDVYRQRAKQIMDQRDSIFLELDESIGRLKNATEVRYRMLEHEISKTVVGADWTSEHVMSDEDSNFLALGSRLYATHHLICAEKLVREKMDEVFGRSRSRPPSTNSTHRSVIIGEGNPPPRFASVTTSRLARVAGDRRHDVDDVAPGAAPMDSSVEDDSDTSILRDAESREVLLQNATSVFLKGDVISNQASLSISHRSNPCRSSETSHSSRDSHLVSAFQRISSMLAKPKHRSQIFIGNSPVDEVGKKMQRMMNDRLHFIKNPRYSKGKQSSDFVVGKAQELISLSSDELYFSGYSGKSTPLKQRLVIRNKSHVLRRVRCLPLSSPFFTVLGPVEKSLPHPDRADLAPGMASTYEILFQPLSLADYEDTLCIECDDTKMMIPVRAANPKPCLISALGDVIRMPPCVRGSVFESSFTLSNHGCGSSRFILVTQREKGIIDESADFLNLVGTLFCDLDSVRHSIHQYSDAFQAVVKTIIERIENRSCSQEVSLDEYGLFTTKSTSFYLDSSKKKNFSDDSRVEMTSSIHHSDHIDFSIRFDSSSCLRSENVSDRRDEYFQESEFSTRFFIVDEYQHMKMLTVSVPICESSIRIHSLNSQLFDPSVHSASLGFNEITIGSEELRTVSLLNESPVSVSVCWSVRGSSAFSVQPPRAVVKAGDSLEFIVRFRPTLQEVMEMEAEQWRCDALIHCLAEPQQLRRDTSCEESQISVDELESAWLPSLQDDLQVLKLPQLLLFSSRPTSLTPPLRGVRGDGLICSIWCSGSAERARCSLFPSSSVFCPGYLVHGERLERHIAISNDSCVPIRWRCHIPKEWRQSKEGSTDEMAMHESRLNRTSILPCNLPSIEVRVTPEYGTILPGQHASIHIFAICRSAFDDRLDLMLPFHYIESAAASILEQNQTDSKGNSLLSLSGPCWDVTRSLHFRLQVKLGPPRMFLDSSGLDFGVVECGSEVAGSLRVVNDSLCTVSWDMRSFVQCFPLSSQLRFKNEGGLVVGNELDDSFGSILFMPPRGVLRAKSDQMVNVVFVPSRPLRLQGFVECRAVSASLVQELELLSEESPLRDQFSCSLRTSIRTIADFPRIAVVPSHIDLGNCASNVPRRFEVELRSLSLVPSSYRWLPVRSEESSVGVSSVGGDIPPGGKVQLSLQVIPTDYACLSGRFNVSLPCITLSQTSAAAICPTASVEEVMRAALAVLGLHVQGEIPPVRVSVDVETEEESNRSLLEEAIQESKVLKGGECFSDGREPSKDMPISMFASQLVSSILEESLLMCEDEVYEMDAQDNIQSLLNRLPPSYLRDRGGLDFGGLSLLQMRHQFLVLRNHSSVPSPFVLRLEDEDCILSSSSLLHSDEADERGMNIVERNLPPPKDTSASRSSSSISLIRTSPSRSRTALRTNRGKRSHDIDTQSSRPRFSLSRSGIAGKRTLEGSAFASSGYTVDVTLDEPERFQSAQGRAYDTIVRGRRIARQRLDRIFGVEASGKKGIGVVFSRTNGTIPPFGTERIRISVIASRCGHLRSRLFVSVMSSIHSSSVERREGVPLLKGWTSLCVPIRAFCHSCPLHLIPYSSGLKLARSEIERSISDAGAFLSVLGYADPDVSSSRKESSHSKDRLSVVAPMQGSTAPSSLLRASARISSFDIGIPAPTVFSDRMCSESVDAEEFAVLRFEGNTACLNESPGPLASSPERLSQVSAKTIRFENVSSTVLRVSVGVFEQTRTPNERFGVDIYISTNPDSKELSLNSSIRHVDPPEHDGTVFCANFLPPPPGQNASLFSVENSKYAIIKPSGIGFIRIQFLGLPPHAQIESEDDMLLQYFLLIRSTPILIEHSIEAMFARYPQSLTPPPSLFGIKDWKNLQMDPELHRSVLDVCRVVYGDLRLNLRSFARHARIVFDPDRCISFSSCLSHALKSDSEFRKTLGLSGQDLREDYSSYGVVSVTNPLPDTRLYLRLSISAGTSTSSLDHDSKSSFRIDSIQLSEEVQSIDSDSVIELKPHGTVSIQLGFLPSGSDVLHVWNTYLDQEREKLCASSSTSDEVSLSNNTLLPRSPLSIRGCLRVDLMNPMRLVCMKQQILPLIGNVCLPYLDVDSGFPDNFISFGYVTRPYSYSITLRNPSSDDVAWTIVSDLDNSSTETDVLDTPEFDDPSQFAFSPPSGVIRSSLSGCELPEERISITFCASSRGGHYRSRFRVLVFPGRYHSADISLPIRARGESSVLSSSSSILAYGVPVASLTCDAFAELSEVIDVDVSRFRSSSVDDILPISM